MRQAAVGFQCPECVAEGQRSTRQARTAYGGRRPAKPGTVTLALIGVNAVVFLAVLATGGSRGWVMNLFALLPTSALGLVDGMPTVIRGVADGAYWQPLTSMFTHVQIWHIGFNMMALYLLGPQMEAMLGRARFAALYLLAGLVGSATVYWLAAPTSQTIGASGAIFGLMGALLVVAIRVRGDVQGLLILVGINVAITVWGRGFISWQGHLGGFVGGLVLALVLVYAPRQNRTRWQMLGLGLVSVLLLLAFALRTLALT
jgi:membrane associated rhomboid family serine protease